METKFLAALLRSWFGLLLCLSTLLPAQDVRELSTPVPRLTYTGVSTTSITNAVNSGYRLVDIEYRGPNLLGTTTFDAVLVQNTGQYATFWWWYYGLTAAQVSANLTANQARLIDLEPYQDSAGNLRFACIMVDNTGANAKTWWWYYGTTTTYLSSQVTANSARIVDLDSYTLGSSSYYAAVMIRNTGTDSRSWWWYLNVTDTQISGYLNTNQARLYDLERRSNGNWDCVMIRPVAAVNWYWWFDLTSAGINVLLNDYGVRAIDLESYPVGSSRRWSMVTINNSNHLTTTVGDLMRSTSSGTPGCWLEEINGANLADLNGTREFEPASTMKTLHHVHAMRRIFQGTATPNTPLQVFTLYQGSCPIDLNPVYEPLATVLRAMMEDSDNARTQAVTAWASQSAINATAAALSMANTSLNHRLGCGAEALTNPNRTTLRDLHWLHEQVVNGYLGGYREPFYELMSNSLSGLGLDTVINTEGASLGLSTATLTSFRSITRLAYKGGSYTLVSGTTQEHRAQFGWISLPFITNDVITPREYSFGAFINGGSNSAASGLAVTVAVRELLRPSIRTALMSWNQSLAGINSIGTGCGTPTFTQTIGGLPRLGTTVTHNANSALPNSLVVMGIGFSAAIWNGVPLPAALEAAGSAPGCRAFQDVLVTHVAVANAAGQAAFPLQTSSDPAWLGLRYLTQLYSFGTQPFLASNAYRNTVGL